MSEERTAQNAMRNAVKEYLRITWADDDALIDGYIARGEARLNQIAGTTLDFEAEGLPRSLLLDYCRYANSQALEVFEQNFLADLAELHYDHLTAEIAAEDEEAEDEDQDAD